VARVEERVAAGSPVRLPDLVGVGVLTAAFPPEVVDLTIERWDVREQRSRLLPARLVAYYVMACVLFMDSAYVEVWNRLLSGLSWARRYRTRREVGMQPSAAALAKARGRLGSEAMEGLLETSLGSADLIYEITDRRNLLPAERRARSFTREQRQPGRRYPRQKDEYKKPLPPRRKIRFWLLTSQDP
jgi:hypothetical protein